MSIIRFYKESTHEWYADIPSYLGPKEDLQMIMGADQMLDIISQENNEVTLYMSPNPFMYANELKLDRLTTEFGEGAFYMMSDYIGINFNLKLWLCDVTKFIFGDFPKIIYFNEYVF